MMELDISEEELIKIIEARKIAFIGAGSMSLCLARTFSEKIKSENMIMSARTQKCKKELDSLGIKLVHDNLQIFDESGIIFLCFKPQYAQEALQDIFEQMRKKKKINTNFDISDYLIISVCAGITTESIETIIYDSLYNFDSSRNVAYDENFEIEMKKKMRIARIMPNTMCRVFEGATALCFSKRHQQTLNLLKKSNTNDNHDDDGHQPLQTKSKYDFDISTYLLNLCGMVFHLEEQHMDAFTAIAGAGPAYVSLVVEALADAGVKNGLPRPLAIRAAAQMLYGSAKIIKKHNYEHPSFIRDELCSPAGSTIAGVSALEKNGFRFALIDAVDAAANRSKELGLMCSKK